MRFVYLYNTHTPINMSDSEEESQERQLKMVLIGDGASGKVRRDLLQLWVAC